MKRTQSTPTSKPRQHRYIVLTPSGAAMASSHRPLLPSRAFPGVDIDRIHRRRR